MTKLQEYRLSTNNLESWRIFLHEYLDRNKLYLIEFDDITDVEYSPGSSIVGALNELVKSVRIEDILMYISFSGAGLTNFDCVIDKHNVLIDIEPSLQEQELNINLQIPSSQFKVNFNCTTMKVKEKSNGI